MRRAQGVASVSRHHAHLFARCICRDYWRVFQFYLVRCDVYAWAVFCAVDDRATPTPAVAYRVPEYPLGGTPWAFERQQ